MTKQAQAGHEVKSMLLVQTCQIFKRQAGHQVKSMLLVQTHQIFKRQGFSFQALFWFDFFFFF